MNKNTMEIKMFFSEEFIKEVENDPIIGLVEACNKTQKELKRLSSNSSNWNKAEHELLWESVAFIDSILKENEISIPIEFPIPTGDIKDNCAITSQYVDNVKKNLNEKSILLRVQSYTAKYKNLLKSSFSYEFSQGDLERIQILINELRQLISENKTFEQDHKQRLLKRLEKLQSEVHKRVSDLDRFWGLVGDAGVVLGKFGNDAKPIVDRIGELARIVWQTQARAEELPSGIQNPMLENK